MEYNHKCIKCSKEYKDTDPDPYYCNPCNEERKIIAEQVTKKVLLTKSTHAPSSLQAYDAANKVRGFARVLSDGSFA